MRGRKVLVMMLGTLFAAALLWAGDPWKEKPYTEWSLGEVDEILQDSPWTRSATVAVSSISGAPVAGSTGKIEHRPSQSYGGGKVFVRWFSSTTLREGFVRNNQFRRDVPEEQAARLASWKPDYYVLQVDAVNATTDAFMEPLDLPLTDDHAPVALELSRGKQKLAPVKRQALGLTELYLFPREVNGSPAIPPEETKVKFTFVFKGHKKSVTFDLRQMTRNGQPDL